MTAAMFGFPDTRPSAAALAPMFVSENSAIWTFFTERCFNGDPYTTFARETRDGETREMPATNHHTAPYSGR
jgi:hypothetical protein